MDTSKREFIKWGVVGGLLAALFAYTFVSVNGKLSCLDLFLMMPPWCKMTRVPDEPLFFSLSPHATACFLFLSFLVLYFFWYSIEADDLEQMEKEVEKEEVPETWEDTEKVLLDNTECLIDDIDTKVGFCKLCIAENNETPGELVGGEVEWALGETSSEEDATRQVTGAHVRKSCGDPEAADAIMALLQDTAKPRSKSYGGKPH